MRASLERDRSHGRTRPQVISRVRDDQGAPPAVTDVDVIDTIYFDGVSTT